jgi:hypothetical protein
MSFIEFTQVSEKSPTKQQPKDVLRSKQNEAMLLVALNSFLVEDETRITADVQGAETVTITFKDENGNKLESKKRAVTPIMYLGSVPHNTKNLTINNGRKKVIFEAKKVAENPAKTSKKRTVSAKSEIEGGI